ncbi:MAG: hypothetical protein HY762_08200 [Planctomycetes bacterium]|nr:hypothetical protein [Planctomycetota bacterium]
MKKRPFIIIITLALLCLLQIPVKDRIEGLPERVEMQKANPLDTLPPTDYLGTYLATTLLGGFKPIIVDYLWLKSHDLQKDKQYETILTLYSIIAKLQPRFAKVWVFNSYHMVYNLSYQEATSPEKWVWIDKGIDYLKEGLQHNPDNPELMFNLAFYYYNRVPRDYYFMAQVEKKEGRNSYYVAADWYRKVQQKYIADGAPQTAELYESMYIAARFFAAFSILRSRSPTGINSVPTEASGRQFDYDGAIKELSALNQYINENVIPNRTIPEERARWMAEARSYQDVLLILTAEKEAIKDRAALPGVLQQYNRLINTHQILEFQAINPHLEFLLTHYLADAYRLIDARRYNEAQTQVKLMIDQTEKLLPKLDNHPAGWYYSALLERFKELENIINSGEKQDSYEKYIKKYDEVIGFHLDAEKQRLEKLRN